MVLVAVYDGLYDYLYRKQSIGVVSFEKIRKCEKDSENWHVNTLHFHDKSSIIKHNNLIGELIE